MSILWRDISLGRGATILLVFMIIVFFLEKFGVI